MIEKQCNSCKQVSPVDLYCKRRSAKDGLSTLCFYCRRIQAKKYDNKDNKKRNWKLWYEKNKEQVKLKTKIRRSNLNEEQRIKIRERDRERYQRDSMPWKKRSRMREQRLILATPTWADKKLIHSTYAMAILLDQINPWIKHHVDHVIPLKGKSVCGLHVENNLSIISAQENLKKGIKLIPPLQ